MQKHDRKVRAAQVWACLGLVCTCLAATMAAGQAANTTAWGHGAFHADKASMLAAQDVVLGQPNLLPTQAMPLGNGNLGIAIWAADGLTVQLNRADTMPHRLSPGKVIVPGLSRLTNAANYQAQLDLYDGEFVASGGGMRARVYVEPRTDTLVIAVRGADPGREQTAELGLWAPRAPKAIASEGYGALAETWKDIGEPGASGLPFGSLAAISGTGRDMHVAVKDARTVELTLRPDARGAFTLRIAAPSYDGTRTVGTTLSAALVPQPEAAHRAWWHAYWHRADLIDARSQDGEAQYMANLRDLYLFYAAAEKGTAWPGSQAGIADMLSAVGDSHMWDPAAFWHWNLRMQTAANLTAGLPELNASYFRLYRQNLENIEAWTHRHMAGRPGLCVPETMRFNGPGIEYEHGPGWATPALGLNCAADSKPYYNARTLSTGAEISFWIWQQYLETDDLVFLRQNYLVMRESARFLLAYQQPGADGRLHTEPSNAHETQWDVRDPITDLAGIRTLYENTSAAASLLHVDAALVKQMQASLTRLPPLPRTQAGKPGEVLAPEADGAAADVLATSYQPQAEQHNVENLGLEPVWPYGLIGVDSPDAALARRTFAHRPYPVTEDWSFDPIQAARLGLGAAVSDTLAKLTEHYQLYPNGLASWGGKSGEFYIEQSGVVADALSEALAQDDDGVIRIAPAVPPGWDMAGSVAIRDRGTVDVQVKNGKLVTAVLEAGAGGVVRVRDPWASVPAVVTDAATGRPITSGTGTLQFAERVGHAYMLRAAHSAQPAYAPLPGTPAKQARTLGSRAIGLSTR